MEKSVQGTHTGARVETPGHHTHTHTQSELNTHICISGDIILLVNCDAGGNLDGETHKESLLVAAN